MHRTEKPQQLQWRFKRATLAVKRASRDAVQKVSNISFLLHWTLRHSPRKSTLNNRTWNLSTRNLGDSEFASTTVFTWQSTLDTFFCAMYMSKAQLQKHVAGTLATVRKRKGWESVTTRKVYIRKMLTTKKCFFLQKGILVWSHSPRQYSTTNFVFFTANHKLKLTFS